MPFADDLLEQAYDLANKEPTNPKQASLRRAVSTAYYAQFHLLIDRWGRQQVGGTGRGSGLSTASVSAEMAHHAELGRGQWAF
jgi:hypothetical protein